MVLTRFPNVGIQARLYFGGGHEIDSSYEAGSYGPLLHIGTMDGGNYMLIVSLEGCNAGDPQVEILDHDDYDGIPDTVGALSDLLRALEPDTDGGD